MVKVPWRTSAGRSEAPGDWCRTSGLIRLVCCCWCRGLEDTPRRCGEVRLRGLATELPLELRLRGEVEPPVEPDLSVLEEACLSCVARVPRGSWEGEQEEGEEEVRGRGAGRGATWGGTVALFIGGEYSARLRPRTDFWAESSCCWTRDSQGLQIRGLPGPALASSVSRRFS